MLRELLACVEREERQGARVALGQRTTDDRVVSVSDHLLDSNGLTRGESLGEGLYEIGHGILRCWFLAGTTGIQAPLSHPIQLQLPFDTVTSGLRRWGGTVVHLQTPQEIPQDLVVELSEVLVPRLAE